MRRLAILFSFSALLLLLLAGCAGESVDLSNSTSLRISRDTTWDATAPISFSGFVDIDGATLTIEEGTEVTFGPEGGFKVGAGAAGGIVIKGSAQKPVRFIAENPSRGFKGILLNNLKDGSSISHLTVNGAKSADGYALTIINNLNIPISNCLLENCPENGLYIKEFGSTGSISNLTVVPRGKYAMAVPANFQNYFTNPPEIKNASTCYVLLTSSVRSQKTNVSFFKLGAPYLIENSIEIDAPEVNLTSGTRFVFGSTNSELVFGCHDTTKVVATSVTFSSLSSDSKMGKVGCDSKTDQSSSFNNCAFENMGIGLDVYGEPFSITGCQFHYSKIGIRYISSSFNEAQLRNDNTFTGCDSDVVKTHKSSRDTEPISNLLP